MVSEIKGIDSIAWNNHVINTNDFKYSKIAEQLQSMQKIVVALIAVAAVGALIGYGWKEAILYIGLPAMGGGIAAGAIPMSKMFGEAMKQDPKTIFSTMDMVRRLFPRRKRSCAASRGGVIRWPASRPGRTPASGCR